MRQRSDKSSSPAPSSAATAVDVAQARDPHASDRRRAGLVLAALCLIVAATAWLRIGYAAIPFERDEGEYAYTAELWLQGVPPYERAYTMKWPGTHAMYALFMATFGHTVLGVRIGFLLMNAATIVLVFSIVRRLFGDRAGLAAAATYAVLSASPKVFGQAAHATQFVVFFALVGLELLLMTGARLRWVRIVAAGISLSLAILMKQSGGVFLGFAGLTLVVWAWHRPAAERRRAWLEVAVFSASACVPIAVMLASVAASGVWSKFWFWTVDYAGTYAAYRTLAQGWQELRFSAPVLFTSAWALWSLALVGFIASWFEKQARWRAIFCAAFTVCAFVGTSAALQFRGHYFVLMLPAVALYAGVAIARIGPWLEFVGLPRVAAAVGSLVLFLASAGQALLHERAVLFDLAPNDAARALYDTNPFAESVRIAEFIRSRSEPGDEIAVIGSEPQLPFLAGLRSASGYLYTYGMMEDQPYAARMQEEMIREVEERAPRFLVYVAIDLSWLRLPSSPLLVFDWLKKYAGANYERVGVVEIQRNAPSAYRFDEAARGTPLKGTDYVLIFQRRPSRK